MRIPFKRISVSICVMVNKYTHTHRGVIFENEKGIVFIKLKILLKNYYVYELTTNFPKFFIPRIFIASTLSYLVLVSILLVKYIEPLFL